MSIIELGWIQMSGERWHLSLIIYRIHSLNRITIFSLENRTLHIDRSRMISLFPPHIQGCVCVIVRFPNWIPYSMSIWVSHSHTAFSSDVPFPLHLLFQFPHRFTSSFDPLISPLFISFNVKWALNESMEDSSPSSLSPTRQKSTST